LVDQTVRVTDSLENPLLRALQAEELDLLQVIWSPFGAEELYGAPGQWPVWDFVSRVFRRNHPTGPSPETVLEGLPWVPSSWNSGARYGLTWIADTGNLASRVIGLSIAGLEQLSANGLIPVRVQDEIASIVGQLATEEERLTPDPRMPVQAKTALSAKTAWLSARSAEKRFEMVDSQVALLLQREYARVYIMQESGAYFALLDGLWLRPFEGVATAAQYLRAVALDSVESNAPELPVSPLTLPQTLDYLGYVLAEHPAWPKGTRLVSAPDLESAGSIALPARTSEEFEARISSVWNVINSFGTPTIPPDVVEARYGGTKQGSISQLAYWLENQLDAEPLAHVNTALTQIRAVRRIRVRAAHAGASTRADGLRAQLVLGLPEYITDWDQAWKQVVARLASAFDVVRQEVQVSSRAS
jgi:hypothetical protein